MVKLFMTIACVAFVTQAHAMEEEMHPLCKSRSVKSYAATGHREEQKNKSVLLFANQFEESVTISATVYGIKAAVDGKKNFFSIIWNDTIKTDFESIIDSNETISLDHEHFEEALRTKLTEVTQIGNIVFHFPDKTEIEYGDLRKIGSTLTLTRAIPSGKKVIYETLSL
ncbi:MAG TPA: hypothetical protein VMW10_06750 [Alphaproteobacteria bacterium]|nr:hypothetical protein [Alphaproteobacteria bacterium]